MLTDVAGLGLALMAIKFAERPATPDRTYGFYRVEDFKITHATLQVECKGCAAYETHL